MGFAESLLLRMVGVVSDCGGSKSQSYEKVDECPQDKRTVILTLRARPFEHATEQSDYPDADEEIEDGPVNPAFAGSLRIEEKE